MPPPPFWYIHLWGWFPTVDTRSQASWFWSNECSTELVAEKYSWNISLQLFDCPSSPSFHPWIFFFNGDRDICLMPHNLGHGVLLNISSLPQSVRILEFGKYRFVHNFYLYTRQRNLISADHRKILIPSGAGYSSSEHNGTC